MPELTELTVKDLQAEAVKLGMPEEDSKTFTTKAPLIATINALKATSAAKRVETLEPIVSPKEDRKDAQLWQSKADRMRESLEQQPKVRVLIPLDPGEKQGVVKRVMVNDREELVAVSGGIWSKTFNGYKVIIPKGVYTEVPMQIADNIAEEFSQTAHAGDQWLVDRIDPSTGKPVRNQLT
jgi:hypothetical protein